MTQIPGNAVIKTILHVTVHLNCKSNEEQSKILIVLETLGVAHVVVQLLLKL